MRKLLALYMGDMYMSYATENETTSYKMEDSMSEIFKSIDERFPNYEILVQNRSQINAILRHYNIYLRRICRLSGSEQDYLSFTFVKEFTLYDRMKLLNLNCGDDDISKYTEAKCLYTLYDHITTHRTSTFKDVRIAILDVYNFKSYVKIREDNIESIDRRMSESEDNATFYNLLRQRALTLPRELYNDIVLSRVNEAIELHENIKGI